MMILWRQRMSMNRSHLFAATFASINPGVRSWRSGLVNLIEFFVTARREKLVVFVKNSRRHLFEVPLVSPFGRGRIQRLL